MGIIICIQYENESLFDKPLNFEFSFDNFLLGDNKIGHHIIVNFPEENELFL